MGGVSCRCRSELWLLESHDAIAGAAHSHVALLQLVGLLWVIEFGQRLEPRPNINDDSAFFRRAEQDADRAHSLLKAEEFLACASEIGLITLKHDHPDHAC